MNCPICKMEVPKKGIRNHILSQARTEAFNYQLNKDKPVAHLDYIKSNYKTTTIRELKIK